VVYKILSPSPLPQGGKVIKDPKGGEGKEKGKENGKQNEKGK